MNKFSPRDYLSTHHKKYKTYLTVLQDFDTISFLSDKCSALYLILIVDDDDTHPEVDETNNRIVRNLLKACPGMFRDKSLYWKIFTQD